MRNIVISALQDATITWSQPAESLFGPSLRSPAASHFSTRIRLKPHTGCCRVRRKRQRLPSNASIRTDAATRSPLFHQDLPRRVTSDRVLEFPDHARPILTNGDWLPLESITRVSRLCESTPQDFSSQ